jgi:hypothetical protein
MATKHKKDDFEIEIIYDYYKQQREEFMNLARERSSLTLQYLVLLGALGAAFLQATSNVLKIGISGVIVILGIIGYTILHGIERTMRLHVARAREARKAIGFLEQYANINESELPKVRGVRKDGFYFGSVYILIVVIGVVFALTVIFK